VSKVELIGADTRLQGQLVLISAAFPPDAGGGDDEELILRIEEAVTSLGRAVAAAGGQLALLGDSTLAELITLSSAEYGTAQFVEDIREGQGPTPVVLHLDGTESAAERRALDNLVSAGAAVVQRFDPQALPQTPAALVLVGGAPRWQETFEEIRRLFPATPVFALTTTMDDSSWNNLESLRAFDREILNAFLNEVVRLVEQPSQNERFADHGGEDTLFPIEERGLLAEDPRNVRLWTRDVIPYALIAQALVDEIASPQSRVQEA
jgi:hypothetical protein